MRVKRYILGCCIWVACLGVVVAGKSESIDYEIHFDSTTIKTYETKEEVLQQYAQLVKGVHDESVIAMVLHNLDQFMWEDNMQAEWKNDRLSITIGDGLGTTIEGDLEASAICFPEVKPKSFLAELFQ